MATKLEDFRAKYPGAYDAMPDAELAERLYTKFYSGMDRREFDARIGLDPYANVIEGTGAALQNVPGRLQMAGQGLRQAAAEGVTDMISPPGLRPGVEPVMGADGKPLPVVAADGGLGAGLRTVLNDKGENALAEAAAMESLKAQLEYQRLQGEQQAIDTAPGSVEGYVAGAIGSVAEMAPGLALSILMRSPAPAMIAVGGQVGGTSYAEGRNEGLTPSLAREYAALNAAAEAIPEALPLGVLLRPGTKFLTRLVQGAAAEAVQESVTEALQIGIDMGYLSPDMTWGEATERMKDAAIMGAIAGPLMGAVAHPAQKVVDVAYDAAAKGKEAIQQLFGAQPMTGEPKPAAPTMLDRVNQKLTERGFTPVNIPEPILPPTVPTEEANPATTQVLDTVPQAPALPGAAAPVAETPAPATTPAQTPAGQPASAADQIAMIESGGNPSAQNGASSAGGLGGFIDSTWIATVRAHAPELAGESDAAILARKKDASPEGVAFQRRMLEAHTNDNAAGLQAAGIDPTPGNTYLAHHFGVAGARQLITADPAASVASVVGPKVMAANPHLSGMTVADVQAWAANKMSGAGPLTIGAGRTGGIPLDAQAEADLIAESVLQREIVEAGGGVLAPTLETAPDTAPPVMSTPAAPVVVQSAADIEAVRQDVNTAPTPAQIEAGNYRKGHVRLAGYDITIETPKGAMRRGTNPDGTPWEVAMPADYGYIKRTNGADGDQIDVYLGPDTASKRVFVVDQIDADTGAFDEHKVIMGVTDAEEARLLYKSAFSDGKGAARLGSVANISQDTFATWLKEGDHTKPFSKLERRKGGFVDVPVNDRATVQFDDEYQARQFQLGKELVESMGLDIEAAMRGDFDLPNLGEARAKEAGELLKRMGRYLTVEGRMRTIGDFARHAIQTSASVMDEGASRSGPFQTISTIDPENAEAWSRSVREEAAAAAPAKPKAAPKKKAEPAQAEAPAKPIDNGTAPEHVTRGVDDRELAQIVEEFNAAQADMIEGDQPISNVFKAPTKKEIVRLQDKAKVFHKDHGWMTPAEARAKIEEWKAHAASQGEDADIRSANSSRVVLSLFDLSGAWSQPWEDAGYQVYRFDIQNDAEVGDVNNFSTEFFGDWFGDFEGADIYAILAACPCTDFASSGARHFAAKDEDGRTVASVKLVHQTLRTIEYFKPAVWAVENPVGRIESLGGLPPWRLSFDPNHLGEPYTKKTLIWGRFNGDLPVAPVEPTEGSKMWSQYGGKSLATKNARSVTPEGFSYSFFMANNAHDHPVMAIANKYDRLDRSAIEAAVKAGATESDISEAVDDFYYFELDDEAANAALRALAGGPAPTPPEPGDVVGERMTVTTPTGQKIEVEPVIIDAEKLQKATGELQPRDRSRAASDAQIEDIAINLDPDRLLPSREADRGAPIIGPDNVVESGNGRRMALLKAAQSYPARYLAYVKAVKAAGYTFKAMEGTPMLVLRRITPLTDAERIEFVNAANTSAIARMSATEQAIADARLIDDKVLNAIEPGRSLNALHLGGYDNKFAKAFLAKLPQAERAALSDSVGQLNTDGVRRIQNAVLAAAYDDAGTVAKAAEATDDNAKSITGALIDVAADWIAMRRDIEVAKVDPAYDMTDALVEALKLLDRARSQAATKGSKVKDEIVLALGQTDIFSGTVDPLVGDFVEAFYSDGFARAKGRDKIAALLRAITSEVGSAIQPQLLGAAPTPQEVISGARRKTEREEEEQGDIFAARAPGRSARNSRDSDGNGTVQRAGAQDQLGAGAEASADSQPGGVGIVPASPAVDAVKRAEQGQQDRASPADDRGKSLKERVSAFEASLESELGLRSLSLFTTSRGDLKLNMIAVPRDKLGQGIGTTAMERIVEFADANGLRVTLTTGQADDGFGTTSTPRLVKFYKRFGFVENKGRNKDFSISENMFREPVDQVSAVTDQIHALGGDMPMPGYVPLYSRSGVPRRPASGSLTISGRKIAIPDIDAPQRREGFRTLLQDVIGSRLYFGKVKGQTRLGFYRQSNSEVRIAAYDDVEVMAHEMAHYLDYHYTRKGQFASRHLSRQLKDEVKQLSYTSDPKAVVSEGFAEFVRLWLTNYQAAKAAAPMFTAHFEAQLKKDPALKSKMEKLQDAGHKWFYQGSHAQLRAKSGEEYTSGEQVIRFMQSYPAERFRQETLDKIHAAKVVERTLKGRIDDATRSAFKQFQMVNGAESVHDSIVNDGTVAVAPDGTLIKSGLGLAKVFFPVAKHGWKRFDLLMDYFKARRASELMSQGRENLFTKAEIVAGLALAEKHPEFAEVFQAFQDFNQRMLDFYEQMGLITPEMRVQFADANKNYVPFQRIGKQIADGNREGATSAIGKRLSGGTQNVADIAENIVEGLFANVRAAMIARAKTTLYRDIMKHQDGSLFAVKLAPDSKKITAHISQMARTVAGTMVELGIGVSKNGFIVNQGNVPAVIYDLDQIVDVLENHPQLLDMWMMNQPPKTDGDTFVDSAIIGGEKLYFEVKEPLLVDMLTGMRGLSTGAVLRAMYGVKNFQTRAVTSWLQFLGPNAWRDTISAAILSKNNFVPIADTLIGMAHAALQTPLYKEMRRQGAGYGTRIEGRTEDTRARRRLDLPPRNIWDLSAKFLAGWDRFFSSFEYGSRAGDYRRGKIAGKNAMQAAWEAREITTDFSKIGRNEFWVKYMRTVPFMNAGLQGLDKTAQELAQIDGKMTVANLAKFNRAKAVFLLKGSVVTAMTLILWLLNHDDERYKALTDDERARFWWVWVPGLEKPFKIPRPYDIGHIFASIPEAMLNYVADKDGDAAAAQLAWITLNTMPLGDYPGIMQPWVEVAMNKGFTGAPIVPNHMVDMPPQYQFSERTPQIYIRLGEAMGVSPMVAQHVAQGYGRYATQFIEDVTEAYFWKGDQWGERPFVRGGPVDMLTYQFIGRRVPFRTKWTEGYYNLKSRAAGMRSALSNMTALAIKDGEPLDQLARDRYSMTLVALDSVFGQIDAAFEDQDAFMASVKYNPNLSAAEKESQIDAYYAQRNDVLARAYSQISTTLDKVEEELR